MATIEQYLDEHLARKLRLGPRPKTETVKFIFACPAELKTDLDRYTELHAQTYGEPVDAVTLIPHMLEAFMARDRGFGGGGADAPGFFSRQVAVGSGRTDGYLKKRELS